MIQMKASKILTKALGWITADGVTTKIVDNKLSVCTGIEVEDGVATVYLSHVKLVHTENSSKTVNHQPYVTPFEINAKVQKIADYTLTISDVTVVEGVVEEATEDVAASEEPVNEG
jgi:hypothetical protein